MNAETETPLDECIARELEERWPGKFSEHECERWATSLEKVGWWKICEAIAAWRSSRKGHMAPSLDEIRDLLQLPPEKLDHRSQALRQYRSCFAKAYVANNPRLLNKPEAEIILIGYRAQRDRVEDTYRQNVDREFHGPITDAQRETYIRNQEASRSGLLRSIVRHCVMDLRDAGMAFDVAVATAAAVVASDEIFERRVDELTASAKGAE